MRSRMSKNWMNMAKVVIIEAFYGGSHKQLLDTVLESKRIVKIFYLLIFFHYTSEFLCIVRCGYGRLWSFHITSKKMALEGENERLVLLTNHSTQSSLWNSIHLFRVELGRIDWFATGFSKMQENRLLSWKSVDLSSPWNQRARLSVWTEWDYDLVGALIKASINSKPYLFDLKNHVKYSLL